MFTTISLVKIHHHTVIFFLVIRTFTISSLSDFQIHDTILLTIVTCYTRKQMKVDVNLQRWWDGDVEGEATEGHGSNLRGRRHSLSTGGGQILERRDDRSYVW